LPWHCFVMFGEYWLIDILQSKLSFLSLNVFSSVFIIP
jgi:hypothetical protein